MSPHFFHLTPCLSFYHAPRWCPSSSLWTQCNADGPAQHTLTISNHSPTFFTLSVLLLYFTISPPKVLPHIQKVFKHLPYPSLRGVERFGVWLEVALDELSPPKLYRFSLVQTVNDKIFSKYPSFLYIEKC
jgi:hypothetical protein